MRSAASLAAFALMHVAACYSPEFKPGSPCDPAIGCPGDLVCVQQPGGESKCLEDDTDDDNCMTRSTGAISDDSQFGDTPWMNVDFAAKSDDKNTVAGNNTGTDGHLSHVLRATNFAFAIPNTATIAGIVVEVERSAGTSTVTDALARVIKGAAIQLTDRSTTTPWSNADGYVTYGSKSDLWGTTWLPLEINDPSFGFALASRSPVSTNMQAYVDHIRITVCY